MGVDEKPPSDGEKSSLSGFFQDNHDEEFGLYAGTSHAGLFCVDSEDRNNEGRAAKSGPKKVGAQFAGGERRSACVDVEEKSKLHADVINCSCKGMESFVEAPNQSDSSATDVCTMGQKNSNIKEKVGLWKNGPNSKPFFNAPPFSADPSSNKTSSIVTYDNYVGGWGILNPNCILRNNRKELVAKKSLGIGEKFGGLGAKCFDYYSKKMEEMDSRSVSIKIRKAKKKFTK